MRRQVSDFPGVTLEGSPEAHIPSQQQLTGGEEWSLSDTPVPTAPCCLRKSARFLCLHHLRGPC